MKRDDSSADVVVVGAGIVGLSVAVALAEAGVDVACLDRSAPGREQSAGVVRMFRYRHNSDRAGQLAIDARRRWTHWERRAGRHLVGSCGVLVIGPTVSDDAVRFQRLGVVHGHVHQHAVASEDMLLARADEVLLDVEGGAIEAAETVAVLVGWLGDRIVRAEVRDIEERSGSVVVETDAGSWVAETVVICAGTGTEHLARLVDISLPVTYGTETHVAFAPCANRDRVPDHAFLDYSGRYRACGYGVPDRIAGRYWVGLVPEQACAAVRGLPLRGATGTAGSAVPDIVSYVRRALPELDPTPLAMHSCVTTLLAASVDAVGAWRSPRVIAVCGNNLFKLAPELGSLLCSAVLEGGVPPGLVATIDGDDST